jgi:heme-degrading monooxygenase HmoA
VFTDPPEPPYQVVVFSSRRREGEEQAYAEAAQQMVELAAQQPGFLGVDSVRGADGFGITVSYWRDRASIDGWREHAAHTLIRRAGRDRWYEGFTVHVATVERAYRYP